MPDPPSNDSRLDASSDFTPSRGAGTLPPLPQRRSCVRRNLPCLIGLLTAVAVAAGMAAAFAVLLSKDNGVGSDAVSDSDFSNSGRRPRATGDRNVAAANGGAGSNIPGTDTASNNDRSSSGGDDNGSGSGQRSKSGSSGGSGSGPAKPRGDQIPRMRLAAQAVDLDMAFFEAQRAGPLPSDAKNIPQVRARLVGVVLVLWSALAQASKSRRRVQRAHI